MDTSCIDKPVQGLLREALEAASAGALVYEAALMSVRDAHLKEEWEIARAQSERHAAVAEDLLRSLGLDPEEPTPGRLAVRDKGIAFVDAILNVLAEEPDAAQIVAAECILDAERKSELNWQLLEQVAERVEREEAGALIRAAYAAVAEEARGKVERARTCCRELWLAQLGLVSRRRVRQAGDSARADRHGTHAAHRTHR